MRVFWGVVLLVFLVVPSCLASTQAEIDALVDIYQSCCGRDWTISTNWLQGDPCNSTAPWFGVSCNLAGNPTKLSLSQNQLCGTIPDTISNLTFINSIYLDSNFIRGLSDQIWNLTSLSEIQLSNNFIRGSIPSNFSLPSNLTLVLLSTNFFSQSLPTSIGNLPLLQVLDLSNNEFSGALPDSLNWPSLNTLKLGNNRFSGSLPSSINLSTQLSTLDITNNSFTGNFPVISNLTSLGLLMVGFNQFQGSLPTLTGLNRLIMVQMYSNKFSGGIPVNFLGSPLLIELDLSYNLLQGSVTTDITNLGFLLGLNLANNQFTGWAGSLLSNSMTYLNLASNSFSDDLASYLPPSSRGSLNYFNISNNLLTGTLPSDLSSFVQLEILDVSLNQFIGSISSVIAPLLNLEKLIIEGNQIQEVLAPILSQAQRFTMLTYLGLGNNFIYGSVPLTIASLGDRVQLVDLSYNQLSGDLPDVELPYIVDITGNQVNCPLPLSWSSSNRAICSDCCEVEIPVSAATNNTSGVDTVEIALLSIGGVIIVLLLFLIILIAGLIVLVAILWKRYTSKLDESQAYMKLVSDEDLQDPRF